MRFWCERLQSDINTESAFQEPFYWMTVWEAFNHQHVLVQNELYGSPLMHLLSVMLHADDSDRLRDRH